MNDNRNLVSIKSIEFEFDGMGNNPTVYFEVSGITLSETVRLQPPKGAVDSYDAIVALALIQLRDRVHKMLQGVDARIFKAKEKEQLRGS